MTQLIAWRGLQGLGAGALEGLSFILVADLYAGRRSAALQGMLAGLMGLSFIAGPLVGGFLADHVGWRWVFLVNLPIGIAAMARGRARAARARSGAASAARASTWPGSRCSPPRSGCCSSASTSTRRVDVVERSAHRRPDRRRAAGRLRRSCGSSGGRPRRSCRCGCSPTAAPRRSCSRAPTGAFGLFAGVLLLPRYFQGVRDVSATHSGLLIYPLLLGLVIGVNVARRADRQARRVPRADPRRPRRWRRSAASGSRPSTPRRPTGRASCYMGADRPRHRPRALRPADRDAADGRARRDRRGDGHAAAAAPGRRVGRAGGERDGLRRRARRREQRRGGHRHRGLRHRARRRGRRGGALVSLPRGATRIALVPAPA